MTKKQPTKAKAVNKKKVLKDLHAVLKANGISAKIQTLEFASAGGGGTACTCPNGKPGVLRVVGKKVVCVC